MKNANPARQEQARLEVENAEDDLVQKTEVAITLMKTVLENVCSKPFYFITSVIDLLYSQNQSGISTSLSKHRFDTIQTELFLLTLTFPV